MLLVNKDILRVASLLDENRKMKDQEFNLKRLSNLTHYLLLFDMSAVLELYSPSGASPRANGAALPAKGIAMSAAPQ